MIGDTVWITGAGSGIGRALARRLAADGHRVWGSARRVEALESLARDVPGFQSLPLDVTDAEACRAASARLRDETGHLNTVIAGAGVCEYVDGPVLDPALFARVMAVNFLGVVNTFHAAWPLLQAAPSGARFVGVGSLAHRLPFTRAEAYGASKAALSYFLRSLRVDLADSGVQVVEVSPGFVATPMTANNDFAMPRCLSVDEAVAAIHHGLARRQSHIRFPRGLAGMLGLLSHLPEAWQYRVCRHLARRGSRA